MNRLDKIIAKVSPEAACRRVYARQKLEMLDKIGGNVSASGYGNYGASRIKKGLLGWLYGGGSADEDIHAELQTLRERTRDLYMGVPIATGALKTMRTNVVGAGLKLQSAIDSDALGITPERARELEKSIEREFALWADGTDCDLERLDNFYELQQLAFLNWLLSGDVIITLPTTKRAGSPYDLRINLIEADRLCNKPGDELDPRIAGGVESNEAGEIIAYYIAKFHPLSSAFRGAPEWLRVEAYGKVTGRRNVLHIMNRERIGQRRGVPFLAPVIEALKQLGRYTDAELVAAVVSGMFTVFIEHASVSEEPPIGAVIPENLQVDRGDPDSLELAPGAILDLNDGEKANSQNPGRPNSGFDAFVTSVMRQIGAALEIPYELLIKHFTASYSASRGALLEFWKSVRMYRSWLAKDFCQPIFEEFFAEAVAKGRIAAPGFFSDPIIRKAYLKAEWNGPAQGLLNPTAEVSAAEKRVLNGFSTRARESQEMNGSDFSANAAQLKFEEKLLMEVKQNEKTNEE